MRKYVKFAAIIIPIYLWFILLVFFVALTEESYAPPHEITWGVTFVPAYAEYLNTEPKDSLNAILDDLGVRNFRLTVPWDRVEKTRGKFTFNEIDWQLDFLGYRDARAIMAIGRRTPRWPECHEPAWLLELPAEQQEQLILGYLKRTVNHLKDREEIVAWQVENEPLLRVFGKCPIHSRDLLTKEIELVRSLDPTRPILTTESGELSTWLQTAPLVDILGISLYRQTFNNFFGIIYYPLTPAFYRRRVELMQNLVADHRIIITELQGEPWTEEPLFDQPIEKQLEIMNPGELVNNLKFAAATGMPEIYIWGAEWWYMLKLQGYSELWEEAQRISWGS